MGWKMSPDVEGGLSGGSSVHRAITWNHTKLIEILDKSSDWEENRCRQKNNTKIPKILNTRHRYDKSSFAIIQNYLKYLIQALPVQIKENKLWQRKNTKILNLLDT